jgi:Rrf2 family protein
MGGFVESERGHAGGYRLARPAEQIAVGEVLNALGGRLFGPEFCDEHSGVEGLCTHSTECSVRSLWNSVQYVVDQMLTRVSLKDMMGGEHDLSACLQGRAESLLQVD